MYSGVLLGPLSGCYRQVLLCILWVLMYSGVSVYDVTGDTENSSPCQKFTTTSYTFIVEHSLGHGHWGTFTGSRSLGSLGNIHWVICSPHAEIVFTTTNSTVRMYCVFCAYLSPLHSMYCSLYM